MRGKTYAIIRTNGTLQQRIQAAVERYKRSKGHAPAEIVVNRKEAEKARRVIKKMGLKTRVETIGGCLVPEVWVRVDEGACEGEPKGVH